MKWRFDFADLGFVYGLLLALSLALINPWGTPRGGVWTHPKVYALIALALLTWSVLLAQLVIFAIKKLRHKPTPHFHLPAVWLGAALLWGAFLGWGLVTAYTSPISLSNALTANDEMGDGWVYWAWVGAFVLGNALTLRRFPQLFKPQLYGVLAAGALMSLAVFAQSADWRLDFTETMRQEVPTPNPDRPNVLLSNIWQGQMPIGLTSHRGHAAFVVAASAVLALVSLLRGWLAGRYAWPLYALSLLGVYFTATRGAQLAFGVGMVYLLVRCWRVRDARRTVLLAFVPLVLGAAGVVGASALGVSGTRTLPSPATLFRNPDAFLSMRPAYWRIAAAGVREQPVTGWGFNGFGLAFPYVNDFDARFKTFLAWEDGEPVELDRLQGTDHYYFRYFGPDGFLYRGRVMSNKAHNLLLDTAVSVGGVGLGLYLLLLGVFFAVTARGVGWGLEAVLVVYLAYGLTWFESAQFSHLAWWALSVGLAWQRSTQPVVRTVMEQEPVYRSAEAG